jgi:hypothetical protein
MSVAYRYMMHVFCNECSVPHPAGIVIELKELLSADQSIGDIYDGREVPPEIVAMAGNKFQCPKTHKSYSQGDNRQVFLVRVA